SHAYLDGFFQKPRVDFELLEQHHEGLVATTGCLGGAVSQAILRDDYDAAREHTARFQSIFGRDSFFVELQDHGLPEQLQVNPLLVAERADAEIEFGNSVLPTFPTPRGHDEDSYLRELCIEGAKERYGISPGPEVLERMEFELGVIKTMGFSAYFLVVWDLVRYARQKGIRVGPGRGSAAGSCVAYCLRIVDIDPIRYDLVFERFLNPGRKQMPDID